MSKFGDDLVQSLGEALAHAKGKGHKIDLRAHGTSHGQIPLKEPELVALTLRGREDAAPQGEE